MTPNPPRPNPNNPSAIHPDLVAEARVGGGRYILKRVLGHGPASEVWLARDAKIGQDIALKILAEPLRQDTSAVERIKSATQQSAQLKHENIARVYDFVLDHKIAAIAMEYVDGWSLWVMRLDKPGQRYRVEEIKTWVYQLCFALDHAHTKAGVAHLGLTPADLLLNSAGQLK